MSHPLTIYWPKSFGNEGAIVNTPDALPVGGGYLPLNSNVPSSQVNPANVNGPYIFDKVARSLLFSAITGFSGTITIVGIGAETIDVNPGPFYLKTEVIGPFTINPGQRHVTTSIWKQINSIHLDNSVGQFLVGFGNTGITDYMFMDSNRIGWHATAQVDVIDGATLEYTVLQSLTKPETPNIQYGNLDVFPYSVPRSAVPYRINNPTDTGIIYGPWPIDSFVTPVISMPLETPVSMVWVRINSTQPLSSTDDALYFTTLQQGLRS